MRVVLGACNVGAVRLGCCHFHSGDSVSSFSSLALPGSHTIVALGFVFVCSTVSWRSRSGVIESRRCSSFLETCSLQESV